MSPTPFREMMIYAAYDQPKDDLPYEEMSEVPAQNHTHTIPFFLPIDVSVLLSLHLLHVHVSPREKRSSLNISRTQSLLTSWLSFSLWRIGKEKTVSTHVASASSRCNLNSQSKSIWQTSFKEVTQHSTAATQGWIEPRRAGICVIKCCDSLFAVSQLTVHLCQTNDSNLSFCG